MTALCAGYFLVLLDVTVVNIALPQLGSALRASGSELAWTIDAYTVPMAALLLASGAVGDRLGHRTVVIGGFAGFGVASAICAMAPVMSMLLFGRAAQGVCAALMLPGTLALITQSAGAEVARARAIGIWAAIGGAALPAGPLLGGLLVQVAGWRSVFWLSVPVIVIALVPIVRARRDDAVPGGGGNADWGGALLVVIMLAAAVIVIIQARESHTLGCIMTAMALCAAGGFWYVERRIAHPLLQVPTGARFPLAAACAVTAMMSLCVLGSLFVLTQLLQVVHHFSPMRTGLVLLPGMLPMPALGATVARLTNKLGPWLTSALGLTTSATGFIGMAAAVDGPSYLLLMGSLLLWGTGLAILTPAIVIAAMRALPEAPGTASGASNTARHAGGALGVAIFSVVAGSPRALDFSAHSTELLAMSALLYGIAAAFCVALRQRDRAGVPPELIRASA
ncbi:MFS transporter [Mycobacterium sp. 050134]|uniref:MFS transporter n=1 Tax=Mycobacterium sp. 050134 TaxID=3096111 RepID=UPI002EDA7C3D